jgi:opacity protein-like surface antigen
MRRFLLALGLLAAAAPTTAQTLEDYDYEDLRFRGVGFAVGYMWPDKVVDTEVYSLRLDLGYLGPGVRIIPSLSYWSSELTTAELNQMADRINNLTGGSIQGSDLGPIEWSDIALSLDGHFVWNTPVGLLGYLGAGIGFHALNGQGQAVDDTFVEDLLDAITAGFAAIAGLEFEPIDRLRIYGEGRFTAMNSIQYPSVKAGLQLMFSPGIGLTSGSVAPVPPIGRTPR